MNMAGYVFFRYLLAVKLTWGHAHKTRSWYMYLLGVTFKKSEEHPCHFYMGVPPGPNHTILVHFDGISGEFGRAMVCILARSKFIGICVIRQDFPCVNMSAVSYCTRYVSIILTDFDSL